MENVTNSFKDESVTPWSPPEINIFFTILLPLLSLLTIIGNLATIVAFWKERSLREKPSDLLILSLSFTDLCDGMTSIPLLTPLHVLGYWPLGEQMCKMLTAVGDIFIFESLLMMICISLDRLLLVSLSYSTYVKLQSRFRVRLTIAICWIIGMVPMTIEMAMWNIAKKIEPSTALINYDFYCLSPPRRIKIFSLLFFFGFVVLPVIIVCCLSVAFIIFLRRKLQRRAQIGISEQSAAASLNANANSTTTVDGDRPSASTRNRYLKPAITLGVLVLAMFICMLPYCMYLIWIEVYCPACNNPSILLGLVTLMHINPLLDPLLYSITQTKIRNYYKLQLRSLFRHLNAN